MQRLISLFREPEDAWPSLAEHEEEPRPSQHGREEPLYFAELMAYLRDRNRSAHGRREPREGAD